jgi:hypothetical protein
MDDNLLLDEATTLYPAWKEALKLWNHTWGDTVPHEWFYEAFGLEPIRDDMTVKQAEAIKLKFLGQFTPFRQALLEDRQMWLDSVPGYGYEVVTPGEQSRRAYESRMRNVAKELRDMARQLQHVNIGLLSNDERRENADLLARHAGLIRALRSRPALPDEVE